ncbi:MAG: hypothetical protein LBT92_02790 [Rickettsiales bacterium]|nr:hypothetical protein [Rickettsiales bacterium]
MKKILLLVFVSLLAICANAQTRRARSSRNANTNSSKVLSDDARQLISRRCAEKTMEAERRPEGKLRSMCSVENISGGESMGPWKLLVARAIQMFKQFRKLIYVAAVFLLLWIVVKAAYKGDGQWMELAWLITGIVALAGAEFFVRIASGQVAIEEVKTNNMYVDCRRPNEVLFQCSPEDSGAVELDERFLYLFSKSAKSKSGGSSMPGLY